MRVAIVLLLLSACSSTPQRRLPPAMEYPGELRPPSAFGDDFMLRQKIEATFGEDQEISFEAVLQKVGDKLTLLGLTPFGSRAFLLEQTGTEVRFESYVDKALPFPPRYILLDIQRTLYVDEVRADGAHDLESEEERSTEIWKDGRLLERRVTRKDDAPPGELVITYETGMSPGDLPKTMRFSNGWFGYALVIETTEARRL